MAGHVDPSKLTSAAPTYCIQLDPNGEHVGLWKFEVGTASRIDVTGDSARWNAKDGLSVLETMKRDAPVWFERQAGFFSLKLKPGEYHPRMARRDGSHPFLMLSGRPTDPTEIGLIAVSRGQMQFLTAQLQRICQTIHPVPETFGAYGHEIRNLLILACTEVEAQWRGVLKASGYDKGRGNWSTKHYMRLEPAMRLCEYVVAFPAFPWLEPITPFADWQSPDGSSAALPWYSAYNGVKHNREGEFERGTLRSAFEAVSACLVLLCAQFGTDSILRAPSELDEFYHVESPAWPATDIYYPPYDGGGWKATAYPF